MSTQTISVGSVTQFIGLMRKEDTVQLLYNAIPIITITISNEQYVITRIIPGLRPKLILTAYDSALISGYLLGWVRNYNDYSIQLLRGVPVKK